ncbi:hypothetical protein ABXN37_00280 [Piscinibacter sakaiensis]|uniref:hypothetical protein n=1 Tax=Piscinibacter sakaiensis TaxID=1547922 RepID=UPI0037269298
MRRGWRISGANWPRRPMPARRPTRRPTRCGAVLDPAHEAQRALLDQALGDAARPLQRYRCAACGFEAQHYFWQCPGCLNWDTYPPVRLEDQ